MRSPARVAPPFGFLLLAVLAGCNPSATGTGRSNRDPGDGVTGDDGATVSDAGVSDAGVVTVPDGGSPANCVANSPDKTGCPCADGPQRACYDGPAGTRSQGACHDGTQACVNGGEFSSYGACSGDTRPSPEAGHCSDGIDNDCNGRIDCADPACANDPHCVTPPDMSMPPPPDMAMGCVFPNSDGRCPGGYFFDLFRFGCCPCSANDCSQPACCVAQVCANAAACQMCEGGKAMLDPACKGLVDSDCDDFPEDCDQLCCPCKPQGQCMPCAPGHIPCNGVCVDAVSDASHCGACDTPCQQGQQCISASCK